MRTKSEKRTAIEAELLRRYPCQRMPRGDQIALAAEFGVQRQYMWRVVRELHMTQMPATTKRICPDCKGPKNEKSAKCRPCSDRIEMLQLTCDVCGKVFLRSLREVKARSTQRGYAGRVYCGRECFHSGHSQTMKEVRQKRYWASRKAAQS